jgi:tetratricopeptide (TPR) repeat protein
MQAEQAYLFRHALLRDAAYELQPPSARAALHVFALSVLEFRNDSAPAELARHAREAQNAPGADVPALEASELRYLWLAAEHAAAGFHYDRAAGLYLAVADHRLESPGGRARALRSAGNVYRLAGRPLSGKGYVERAIAMAREAADPAELGSALALLGDVHAHAGAPALAEENQLEALAVLRAAGLRDGEALSLNGLGALYMGIGRGHEAEPLLARALQIAIELKLPLEARVRANIATLHRFAGKLAEAVPGYRAALEMFRKAGDRVSESAALSSLAVALQQSGEAAEAEDLFRAAWALSREVGNRRVEAEALLHESLAMMQEIGDRRAATSTISNLASMYMDTGRDELAAVTFRRGLALSRESGDARAQSMALNGMASLCLRKQQHEQAREYFEQAVRIALDAGAIALAGALRCNLGVCLLRLHDPQARQTWLEGAAMLEQCGDFNELGRRRTAMLAGCKRAGVPPFAD